MKILVIGQSHAACVRTAANAHKDKLGRKGVEIQTVLFNDQRFNPWIEHVDVGGVDGLQLVPVLRDEILSRVDQSDLIVSYLGGNAHNILSLVDHPRPYDFVFSDERTLPLVAGREVVPEKIAVAALETSGRVYEPIRFLKLVRQLVPSLSVHLESPAPVPSEEHIRKFPDVFREPIEKYGVAPASLRYKLWRINSKLVQNECNAMGVRYLPVPDVTQDADGYLVEAAWYMDPVHANQWYGERVIEQLVRLQDPAFSLLETV